jgi:hypothetical protein
MLSQPKAAAAAVPPTPQRASGLKRHLIISRAAVRQLFAIRIQKQRFDFLALSLNVYKCFVGKSVKPRVV